MCLQSWSEEERPEGELKHNDVFVKGMCSEADSNWSLDCLLQGGAAFNSLQLNLQSLRTGLI